jgi:hypothetical protein
MKLLFILTSFIFWTNIASPFVGFHKEKSIAWGQTGHRVIGLIAEMHLTNNASSKIEKLLDGKSLAFVSTYADEIKSERSYSKYSPWHYVNYPLETRYNPANRDDAGDVIFGIEQCIEVLSDTTSSIEDQQFYLALLVHLIGDMHMPLHIGRQEDRGGNNIKLSWFSKSTNLHRLWDSDLIESVNLSYTELAAELNKQLSKKKLKQFDAGTYLDWVEDSHEAAATVYASAKQGDRLAFKYSYKYNDLLFTQLQKGGVRLARLLNQLFD